MRRLFPTGMSIRQIWIPYCGAAPAPAELLGRWNLDPVLLVALGALALPTSFVFGMWTLGGAFVSHPLSFSCLRYSCRPSALRAQLGPVLGAGGAPRPRRGRGGAADRGGDPPARHLPWRGSLAFWTICLSSPAAWLIWRRDLQIFFRSVNAAEAQAIDASHSGKSFGELCVLLCEHLSEQEAPAYAARLLREWIESGLLVGVQSAGALAS